MTEDQQSQLRPSCKISSQKPKNLCDYVYLSLGISFLATIVIAAIFVTNVHQFDDLSALRETLKNDLIVNDIKRIVQIVLKDMENDDKSLREERKSDSNHVESSFFEYGRKMSQEDHMKREKRSTRIVNSKTSGMQTENHGKYVEFFNPKIRRELEKKDDEFKRAYGYKGAAPGGDEWVWLTSYCRIPYESITGFCSATKEYCPAGPAGIPGSPGPKGYRGDIGMPGPPGRVARGPKGMIGSPGLDGRDGIPGEPGLDGVPGRAGADGKDGIPGMPGKDGIPGIPGTNGRNGIDGKHGSVGAIGPPGRPGPAGEMGIAGPRGLSGEPGLNGAPGLPGVKAYSVKVNGSTSDQLLVAPSIIGANIDELKHPIVVNEGDSLRLRCAANGIPLPKVEWRIKHSATIKPINIGAWQESSIGGHTLNITHINREHMGKYQCIADNGIPPHSSATFDVEVHFAPLMFVRNQYLYVAEGGSVSLECETESFPEPVQFWKRKSENIVLDSSSKYKMDTYRSSFVQLTDSKMKIENQENIILKVLKVGMNKMQHALTNHFSAIYRYKSRMQLNITKVQKDDYGEYLCVSKNEVNTTTAIVYVNDKMKPPNRGVDTNAIAIFGPSPPARKSYEDICGPTTKCNDCQIATASNCKDTIATLYDLVGNLEIKHAENRSFSLFPNRKIDCALNAVGKPIYHNDKNMTFGSWLRDALPKNAEIGEKIWMTNESDILRVYEYKDKKAYQSNTDAKMHKLDPPGFRGNAHVVYNGSFYYQENNSDKVVRYDLEFSKPIESRSLYKAAASGPNFLYTTKHNYMDFNVDENGLWVIYATADSNHTHVAKLDPYTLEAQYNWNISVNHHKVGEMFIVCGVLYAIDSVVERYSDIRLALDLYENKLLNVKDLKFANPFKKTTTVGYNHRNKELYSWDGGNQLTYPTRSNDIGYNNSSSKWKDGTNSQIETGYKRYPAKTSGNH